MNDSEKVKLISLIIADFWEFQSKEEQQRAAMGIVNAIASVVDFESKGEGNHGR